jgi:predicted phosphodiesterase
MRLGILADIHEDIERLKEALTLLRRQGTDRFVILGDVFETGQHLRETVALLRQVDAIGVWGNHDLGLCHEPDERVRNKYPGTVLDFMTTLRPSLELDGCLFTHGLPFFDPTDPTIYYLGGYPHEPQNLVRCFQATTQRVLFVGHTHRWLLATPEGCLPWRGETPVCLEAERRWFVVVHAVCDGWRATYDTITRLLTPFRIGMAVP